MWVLKDFPETIEHIELMFLSALNIPFFPSLFTRPCPIILSGAKVELL